MRPSSAALFGALLALLLLAPLAAAFNVTPYLTSGETEAQVRAQPLATASGAPAALYFINNVPSLVVVDDKVLTTPTAIEAALRESFQLSQLPTAAEWKAVRDDIEAFNKSRDFATRFGPAERTCLQYTGLTSSPCDSLSTCFVTASIVCNNFASNGGGGGCYPDVLAPLIFNYYTSVKSFQSNVPVLMSSMASVAPDKAVGLVSDAQTRLAALKKASANISQNALRFPENGDTCMDCIGLCPAPHLATASLDAASAKLNNLSARYKPLADMPAQIAQVAQSTQDRMAYQEASAVAAIWKPRWDSFKAKNAALKDNATAVALYVRNISTASILSQVETKWAAMEARFTSRNFVGIDADYTDLTRLVESLKAPVAVGLKPYSEAKDAQDKAGDALTRARWSLRTENKASVTFYNSLVQRKNGLDANFTPPKSAEEYKTLARQYALVTNDSNNLIQSQIPVTDAASSVGQQFGQTAINGVFSLTDALVPLPATTRNQVSPFIPPVVLLLSDLAIVSVALLTFIALLLYFKPLTRSRTLLGMAAAALFVFLFVLGLGSVGLFIFINQSAQSGAFSEFETLLSHSNASYVAVNTAGAPSDATAAMLSCAKNITGQLKARWGKPAYLFTYSNKTCSTGNLTNQPLEKCFASIGSDPVFYLNYNRTAALAPKFSVVYQHQAAFFGDTSYYTRCEIGDVLD